MDKVAITSPVMRTIGVENIVRSSAFYRDILGFAIREGEEGAEAASGPARIRFENTAGSAVVFFQVDDVGNARAGICARGGKASEIEKVNWIKMRMFEVRDPDGHALWFGQSYRQETDSPSRRPGQPEGMRQALPELPFRDVAAAVNYYRDVLGFRINYQQHDLGVMDRDAITVLLIERTEQYQGIGSFGVYVEDADALHAELVRKGANVLAAPVSRPWGLRNFDVLDCEGNRIRFSQTFE